MLTVSGSIIFNSNVIINKLITFNTLSTVINYITCDNNIFNNKSCK